MRKPVRVVLVSASVMAVVCLASVARAQKDPKFEYGKKEEVGGVEWKAQAKGGLLLATGNAQTKSGTLSANVSRKQDGNRFAAEGGIAYGTSNVQSAVIDPSTNTITGIERRSVETTNLWNLKARYDRFFTSNNTAFATGLLGGDAIAGKSLFGGGQLGYSRQIYKSERHLVVAEAGYDFSFERYVQQPNKTIDPVSIHSGRLFAAETAKLAGETGATLSVEALFNLNHEAAPNAEKNGAKGVDAFHDTRVNAKAGLTTTLWKNISFGFGFTLKYDQNPAPRPIPSDAKGASFSPTWMPFARKVDTLTEANLVVTFL